MTKKTQRSNKSPGADPEARPEDAEVKRKGAHEMSTLTSGREGEASGATGSSAPVGEAAQAGSSTRSPAQAPKDGPSNSGGNGRPSDDRTPGDTVQSTSSEMPPMIGDFDDNANALWSLHLKEAMSHDQGRIQSLKDDMDGILLFAGLFSASLTSFLVDKIHDLQVDPARQMVYYQQQNVALLAQISNQVSSIAPQISIPSTPPPPYPDFNPKSSDVRVNAYWFMSLVFSLSAALLATLVQRWVRDYMHVFQRYSNPLKSARLRQYLYEGVEGWYMPVVAEAVPGLVHVSLFLFFVGLGDSLLAVHTTIGIITIVQVTICGLLYVLSTFAPVVNPQSPFQNSFSNLIWYLTQKVQPRSYTNRASGGALKAVSSNMSEGRVQLAMEENPERKERDVRAIQWLIHNRTEDDEMESFALAIPGAFTSKWGIEVWRKVSEVPQYEDVNSRPNDATVQLQMDADLRMSILPHHGSSLPQRTRRPRSLFNPLERIIGIRSANGTPRDVTVIQSAPHLPESDRGPNDSNADLAVYDLCERVRHLLDTCDTRGLFTKDELWRKRARGCVETVASLVFCADVKLELFGDLGRLLGELGGFERIRELSAAGSDGAFVTRWTCLSLVVITRGISNHTRIKENAHSAISDLSWFQMEDGDIDERALKNARRIDSHFETASQFCVYGLRRTFKPWETGRTEEQVREDLARDHEADISMLEGITPAADHMEDVDSSISWTIRTMRSVTPDLIVQLPGVSFDKVDVTELVEPIGFHDPSAAKGQALTPQLISLYQRLRLLCSYAPKLRDLIAGRGNGVYQELLESLKTLWDDTARSRSIVHHGLIERQLWRLQDLRDGGCFGFSVELFFLSLPQLSSMASSRDTHSSLYIGTFRAITSDWRKYKHSIGTQRVILNLICDMAIPYRGVFSNRSYPRFITEEFLVFLGNMVEGQSGPHIDDAMKELKTLVQSLDMSHLFRVEAIEVISRSRAPVPS